MQLNSSMTLICNSMRVESYGGGWLDQDDPKISIYLEKMCGSHYNTNVAWYRDTEYDSETTAGRGICNHWSGR